MSNGVFAQFFAPAPGGLVSYSDDPSGGTADSEKTFIARCTGPRGFRELLPLPESSFVDNGVLRWSLEAGMPKTTATFEQLDHEHRSEVTHDAERLRTGQVTPEALQAENSILPPNTRVRIRNLIGYAKKAYLRT